MITKKGFPLLHQRILDVVQKSDPPEFALQVRLASESPANMQDMRAARFFPALHGVVDTAGFRNAGWELVGFQHVHVELVKPGDELRNFLDGGLAVGALFV